MKDLSSAMVGDNLIECLFIPRKMASLSTWNTQRVCEQVPRPSREPHERQSASVIVHDENVMGNVPRTNGCQNALPDLWYHRH